MELSTMDKLIIPGLFSPMEKQAMYQVMCAVRQIGAHHMADKERHIHEVMSIVGITPADQQQSRSLTQMQMTEVLKRMDDAKKLYFAKFTSITAIVGGPTQKEVMFLNWLYAELNVPSDF